VVDAYLTLFNISQLCILPTYGSVVMLPVYGSYFCSALNYVAYASTTGGLSSLPFFVFLLLIFFLAIARKKVDVTI
jgi:hypothetical protein